MTGSRESLADSGCNAGGGGEEFVVVDVALGETVGGGVGASDGWLLCLPVCAIRPLGRGKSRELIIFANKCSAKYYTVFT